MSVGAVQFSPRRMRKARLRRGWTQEDLARETGHSLSNVGRWERGDNKPDGAAVVVIARATGHDIDFFYVEGDGEDEEEEAAMREKARELLASYTPGMVEVLMDEAARMAKKRAEALR